MRGVYLILFFLFCSHPSFGQGKFLLSFTAAPVANKFDYYHTITLATGETGNAHLKQTVYGYLVGLSVHYTMTDKFYFSSGLWYNRLSSQETGNTSVFAVS